MTIMKQLIEQLIEQMVGDYLNESYEDDLVESIFEEVSEETWEAIQEAILNELSPKLLARYKKKAETSMKRADTYKTKATDDADKANRNISRGYAGDRSVNIDKQYDRMDKADKKIAKHDSTIRKRTSGIARASDAISRQKADLNNLSAADFEKRYRMSKADWKRKNK